MNFNEALTRTQNNRKTTTENGAVGYETSDKALLDFNFKVTSLRGASAEEIITDFSHVYFENPYYAKLYLMYLRDVRGGMGERRIFRICLDWLLDTDDDAINILVGTPEIGRWDDVLYFHDNKVAHDVVVEMVRTQLEKDLENYKTGEPVSLLAKWMPSNNCSSIESITLANKLTKELGLIPKIYRKTLVKLRKATNVVEQKMSANEWSEIDYSAVPSKANLLYKDAFNRHDYARRAEFLDDVQNGVTKINADTVNPYEIVKRYYNDEYYYHNVRHYDRELELAWQALPNKLKDDKDVLVVLDTSGSMMGEIPNSRLRIAHVANSLAIYFAERLHGQFRNKIISFSRTPKYLDLANCKTLRDKVAYIESHSEVANTNITATMRLILNTARQNHMHQSDLPSTILILSDMEFDGCVEFDKDYIFEDSRKALFEDIQREYESYGYKMPRVAFWNIGSRTNAIPLKQNDLGVALISGFSTSVAEMVMSNELDPYKALIKTITKKRYTDILSDWDY